jgi:hypothetical protein
MTVLTFVLNCTLGHILVRPNPSKRLSIKDCDRLRLQLGKFLLVLDLFLSVHPNIYLLIIESDISLDCHAFRARIAVPPDDIFDHFTRWKTNVVVVRFSLEKTYGKPGGTQTQVYAYLVWTLSGELGRLEEIKPTIGLWNICSHLQTSLE